MVSKSMLSPNHCLVAVAFLSQIYFTYNIVVVNFMFHVLSTEVAFVHLK
jgi:hypothetical protein